MNDTTEIKIDFKKTSRHKATLTARAGGQVLHVDEINPASVKARTAYLDDLAARCPVADRQALGDELLRIADSCAQQPEPEAGKGKQGADDLGLKDFEPWPEVVDGAELLAGFEHLFRRYAVLPPHGVVAVVLWCLYSHVFDSFDVSPLLAFQSPTPRCGKTTLLSLIGGLVPRALPSSNFTAPVMYRVIEGWTPTVLIDEAETIFTKEREELRGLVNSGHTRTAARACRCVGDDNEVRGFSVWAPKCLALIGKLPSTLQDRSVVVPMRRKAKNERVDKLRLRKLHLETNELGRKAARWAADHGEEMVDADPIIPDLGNDRAEDNWSVLLAVADDCGGAWPARARAAAVALVGASEEVSSTGELLLADLRAIFEARGQTRITTADIISDLCAMEERPWPTYGRASKGINAQDLGRLLRPFEVASKNIKIDGRSPKGYDFRDLRDPFTRYLPPLRAATPLPAAESQGNSENLSATEDPDPCPSATTQPSVTTTESASGSGVADEKPTGERSTKQQPFRFQLGVPGDGTREKRIFVQDHTVPNPEEV